MTNQKDEVLQNPALGVANNRGSKTFVFGAIDGKLIENKHSEVKVPDHRNNLLVKNEPLPEEQPEWYKNLDEVLKSEVRHLCEEAGPPPSSDAEVLSKLQKRFNLDEKATAEAIELFFQGKLQPQRKRLKSILRSSEEGPPPLKKQLSWSDDKGLNLTEKHVLDSWHHMYSHRNSQSNCCSIL